MKGFFRWFKSSTKMKRWILLLVIGIVLACYGMARVLVAKTFDFKEIAVIIGIFVIGFVCVILGIIHMQKRTLELLVQESDSRELDKKAQVSSLIFNKKVYNQGPKIVAIGGGSGLNSVLRGLKNYTDNITAIVTISDYGEKRTDSRRELDSLPLNDIKESLVALAENEEDMEKLLNLQFKEQRLNSLNFGDIYLKAMKDVYGDFTQSIEKTNKILHITGKVLPVTLEPITICAELEDGTVIESKEKIPDMVNEKVSKINRIYINPTNCKPAPGVLEAIAEADAIVIGPGSLYTNVIPNLLVKGVSKAIKESKAFKIYVNNIMTEQGQTDNYTLSDHIKVINEHAGKGVIDYCIYDSGELTPEFIRKYNMRGQDLVEIDAQKAKSEGVNLMQRDISYVSGEFKRHNPDAIAASIIQLICDDLKFKDMQNDAKYMLLNDRLKDAKKSLKNSKKKKQKENKNNKGNNKQNKKDESKFFKKYKDRIESIQESEKKLQEKEKKAVNNKKENIKNVIEKEVKTNNKTSSKATTHKK